MRSDGIGSIPHLGGVSLGGCVPVVHRCSVLDAHELAVGVGAALSAPCVLDGDGLRGLECCVIDNPPAYRDDVEHPIGRVAASPRRGSVQSLDACKGFLRALQDLADHPSLLHTSEVVQDGHPQKQPRIFLRNRSLACFLVVLRRTPIYQVLKRSQGWVRAKGLVNNCHLTPLKSWSPGARQGKAWVRSNI